MINHTGQAGHSRLPTDRRPRVARKAEGTWSGGRIGAVIRHWSDAEPQLLQRRSQHKLILTLSGGSDLTRTKISGSPVYEGRDSAGCITFVPADAERRGWYRNVDIDFVDLLIAPDFISTSGVNADIGNLLPFTNQHDPLVERIMFSLACEMLQDGNSVPELYTEHAAGLLICHLMRSPHHMPWRVSSKGGLSAAQLRVITEYIEDNLHHDISLLELGRLVGMGIDVFSRKFKAQLGVPPYRYVTERRIRRAELLLADSKHSIADIALRVGFSSQSHLTTQFSKLLSVTPAAYRARHRS